MTNIKNHQLQKFVFRQMKRAGFQIISISKETTPEWLPTHFAKGHYVISIEDAINGFKRYLEDKG